MPFTAPLEDVEQPLILNPRTRARVSHPPGAPAVRHSNFLLPSFLEGHAALQVKLRALISRQIVFRSNTTVDLACAS